MRRRRALIAFAITAGLSSVAAAGEPALLSLSARHFEETATVTEDPAAGTTTITTESGFREHTGLMRMVWNDEYLRGVIDRRSGRETFEVDVMLVYNGKPRSYEAAAYPTDSGPRRVSIAPLGREVVNCEVGDCTYTERLSFPVDAQVLRQAAMAGAPDRAVLWRYTLSSKTGPAYSGGLSSAEIAGFLARVDESAGRLSAATPLAAADARPVDLGVGGMAVAATGGQPDRSGVLIIQISRGSAAERAGIIVGDIVFEFDGHAIKQLADLQAAIAACQKNSAVSVKLYRGIAPTSLTVQF
jgi:hypothetical protein